MLKSANGSFEDDPINYINLQLRYHFKMSRQDLSDLSDEEWAQHYAILNNIRQEEAKQRPF